MVLVSDNLLECFFWEKDLVWTKTVWVFTCDQYCHLNLVAPYNKSMISTLGGRIAFMLPTQQAAPGSIIVVAKNLFQCCCDLSTVLDRGKWTEA